MPSIEASETVDAKDTNLNAGGNVGRNSVEHPLNADTADEKPKTQPIDSFPDFPFRPKGRPDSHGIGRPNIDPYQVKTSTTNGQGTGSSKPGGQK